MNQCVHWVRTTPLLKIRSDAVSHVQSNQEWLSFASGTFWLTGACSTTPIWTTRLLAKPVNTCGMYGLGNIVVGCFHCTWWYGANRGICQKQSGVMEERDRAGARGRGGGRNSLGRDKISSEHQPCVRQRPEHEPTPTWIQQRRGRIQKHPNMIFKAPSIFTDRRSDASLAK